MPLALLAAGGATGADVTAVLRELGFDAVPIDVKDSTGDFGEPVSLCLVDLCENGNALPIDTIQAQLQYPENITLYGFSFNTTIGDLALQGEIAYRPRAPLQVGTSRWKSSVTR
mgnify:CR=1 FL=1